MGLSSVPRMLREPCSSPSWDPRLDSGAHFVARECHFSLGSPSRKLLSAHRGWGLPTTQSANGSSTRQNLLHSPRSSRTRDSSSAIRLRRRVFSSTVGSSLVGCQHTTGQTSDCGLTEALGRRSRRHTVLSRREISPYPVRARCATYQTELDTALTGALAITLAKRWPWSASIMIL